MKLRTTSLVARKTRRLFVTLGSLWKRSQMTSRQAEKPTCKSRSNASQSDPWATKTTFLVMKTNTHICPIEMEININKMSTTLRPTANSSAKDATLSAVQMDNGYGI